MTVQRTMAVGAAGVLAGVAFAAANMHTGAAAQPVPAHLAMLDSAAHPRTAQPPAWWRYEVQPGDTLAEIAYQFYGDDSEWAAIYDANRAVIPATFLIPAGVVIRVPCQPVIAAVPAAPARPAHLPAVKHRVTVHRPAVKPPAAPAAPPVPPLQPKGSTQPITLRAYVPRHAAGDLSGVSIEHMWTAEGGAAAAAPKAACVAGHESGGNPSAISPTGDWGLYQIHGGGPAMLNPVANTERAIAMSRDGTDWSQWTTNGMC